MAILISLYFALIRKIINIFTFVSDSAFKQQKLPAWQPILTAGTVLPTFFVIGIAFIPIGIGLLYFSDEVKEHIIDYTNCNRSILNDSVTYSFYDTNETCIEFKKNSSEECYCRIPFQLTETFEVLLTFKLSYHVDFTIILERSLHVLWVKQLLSKS